MLLLPRRRPHLLVRTEAGRDLTEDTGTSVVQLPPGPVELVLQSSFSVTELNFVVDMTLTALLPPGRKTVASSFVHLTTSCFGMSDLPLSSLRHYPPCRFPSQRPAKPGPESVVSEPAPGFGPGGISKIFSEPDDPDSGPAAVRFSAVRPAPFPV